MLTWMMCVCAGLDGTGRVCVLCAHLDGVCLSGSTTPSRAASRLACCSSTRSCSSF